MAKAAKIRRVRFDHWGYIFVTPFFLAFLAFQLYPIINTFYLGFTNMKGSSLDHQMVGAANFFRDTQALKLEGLTAEKANSLMAALGEANIQGDTDAPAPAAEPSPFDLDLDLGLDEEAGAEASDPYALTDEVVSTAEVTYFVRVTQMDAATLKAVQGILAAQEIPAADVEKSLTTVYAGLVFDQKFWQAFGNTAFLFFLNFIPQLFFALVFAVWFADVSLKIRLGGLFKTILYLPNIITAASVAVLFASLFGYPSGPINQFTVQTFGMSEAINYFRSEIWTRGIVAFIQFWMWYGTTIIVLSAGILGISPSLFESAVVDGAKPGQMFWRITLPLLRPIMSFTLVTSLIGGLQMFDIPFLLTNRRGDPGGSINTTAIYLYNQAFSSANNYSYAATISVGMFLLILVLAGFLFRMMRDPDDVKAKGARK